MEHLDQARIRLRLSRIDVDDLIGTPFEVGGRERTGADCWGLFRLVYQRLGIELPRLDAMDAVGSDSAVKGLMHEYGTAWREVALERPGDGALIRSAGEPFHVAVIVAPGMMLHTERSTGAIIERYQTSHWQRRVRGFFRHECFS